VILKSESPGGTLCRKIIQEDAVTLSFSECLFLFSYLHFLIAAVC
jgi:hypothetical protein